MTHISMPMYDAHAELIQALLASFGTDERVSHGHRAFLI